MLRGVRSSPARRHASSSSARISSARATRSPGSVAGRDVQGAACRAESLPSGQRFGVLIEARQRIRKGPLLDRPVWTPAAPAKPGKRDSGSVPGKEAPGSPGALFRSIAFALHLLDRLRIEVLFKAYTILRTRQSYACKLLPVVGGGTGTRRL
jgi:hypothetical protein